MSVATRDKLKAALLLSVIVLLVIIALAMSGCAMFSSPATSEIAPARTNVKQDVEHPSGEDREVIRIRLRTLRPLSPVSAIENDAPSPLEQGNFPQAPHARGGGAVGFGGWLPFPPAMLTCVLDAAPPSRRVRINGVELDLDKDTDADIEIDRDGRFSGGLMRSEGAASGPGLRTSSQESLTSFNATAPSIQLTETIGVTGVGFTYSGRLLGGAKVNGLHVFLALLLVAGIALGILGNKPTLPRFVSRFGWSVAIAAAAALALISFLESDVAKWIIAFFVIALFVAGGVVMVRKWTQDSAKSQERDIAFQKVATGIKLAEKDASKTVRNMIEEVAGADDGLVRRQVHEALEGAHQL